MTTRLVQCPSCSAEVLADSRFCSSCGEAIVAFSQMLTALPRNTAAAAQPARHISSDSIPAGGFTPGTILIDRYRIIGLLGRGGMGEVYRADDLKLGQPVALKFLPRALAADPVRRERFFAEVRITRQLAHPNICRVYDIAEVDGQHFLSMEYIDGEDLASLIKRIGFLTNEKALDIARQLAAGLAAAHEKGVLHRDLKPANIMIDGHGRVRITDFGLAIAAAEEQTEAAEILGTPAYMAPEQFAGKGATTRSDIYSLGLILYEIYSGKRAFTATTIAELREQKESHTPRAPSEIRQGIDPVVERLIQRCLERDPRARPASVAQLALALPGGDPLAAALAAGETPSPELVAASGLKEGLRPAVAIGILAWVIMGSLLGIALGSRTMQRHGVPAVKSPAFLEERSREFLRRVGYPADFAESSFEFTSLITDGRLSGILFLYRESPRPLIPVLMNVIGPVRGVNPPLQTAGEVLVMLDMQGRLRSLQAIAPEGYASGGVVPTADWTLLFSEAGLDRSKWTPTEPLRNPKFFADTRAAWVGSLTEQPEIPARVEAAAYQGKPVGFDISASGTQTPTAAAQSQLGAAIAIGSVVSLLLIFIICVMFFVRQNVRLGRGDRRGATRLALLSVCLTTAIWTLRANHSASGEVVKFRNFIGQAFLLSALFWGLYIAIEPAVRRRWPHLLVSWTRLLSGEWRDSLVGRDTLVGCAFGVLLICISQPLGYLGETSPVTPLRNAMGVGWFTSALIEGVGQATLFALGSLCLLSFLRILLRSDRVAVSTILILPVLFLLPGFKFGFGTESFNPWSFLIQTTVPLAIYLFVLMRFGLVALAVAVSVEGIFGAYPMTLQSSLWYSPASYAALAVILVIAFYGFRTSVGGRPILDALGGVD